MNYFQMTVEERLAEKHRLEQTYQAMKDKNTLARAIYGVVMNKVLLAGIEAKKDGKEVGDVEVVQILQKILKNLYYFVFSQNLRIISASELAFPAYCTPSQWRGKRLR